mgnify:CR=1 FL=1
MIRIRIGNWAIHRSLDAAEFIDDDGLILAGVAEPQRRDWQRRSRTAYWWDSEDERRFRQLLVGRARREFRRTRYIQIDPGRENAVEIDLEEGAAT